MLYEIGIARDLLMCGVRSAGCGIPQKCLLNCGGLIFCPDPQFWGSRFDFLPPDPQFWGSRFDFLPPNPHFWGSRFDFLPPDPQFWGRKIISSPLLFGGFRGRKTIFIFPNPWFVIFVVVSYDIPEDQRRTKIHKILKSYFWVRFDRYSIC